MARIHRWEEYVTKFVYPDLQRFGDFVRVRILPIFADIEREADELAARRYMELMSSVASPEDYDEGEIPELAMEAGYEHYDMLSSMRWASLNLLAAALYHLTEQHMIDLYLRVIDCHSREEVSIEEAIEWFKTNGDLNPTTLPSWELICELRLLANVVKHAEGRSATKLREKRPGLFLSPHALGGMSHTRVRKPLFGQDFYVTPEEFARYHDGSVAFWMEFAERLSTCPSVDSGQPD